MHIAKTDGPLALVWSWPDIDLATLNPTMVVISRDTDGRWYATLAVDVDQPAPAGPAGAEIGVDLGVKDFAVLSTGERIANPRHLERKARNLARYQRRMARCQGRAPGWAGPSPDTENGTGTPVRVPVPSGQ
ncbi:transposase [Micromonosporaceae bacterium B7E4]